MNMEDLREHYSKETLNEKDLSSSPFTQFEKWFQNALDSRIKEPNAMILSTLGEKDIVDSRTVLLKGLEQEQFVFYTNYNSDKSKQLREHPNCSLLFLWLDLERQIRIQGKAEKLDASKSDEYFASRPRGSQLGAWVSDQSSRINSRDELEAKLKEVEQRFEGKEVSRPEHWGGFAVTPNHFEFWQGRPNRLHDRLVYEKEGSIWTIKRLQP
ncbi:pyridoxamine 5'-phosphate oxidase [bacterium]|nr:pyridoxamine 5'-phosphate oxidase [bacterium]